MLHRHIQPRDRPIPPIRHEHLPCPPCRVPPPRSARQSTSSSTGPPPLCRYGRSPATTPTPPDDGSLPTNTYPFRITPIPVSPRPLDPWNNSVNDPFRFTLSIVDPVPLAPDESPLFATRNPRGTTATPVGSVSPFVGTVEGLNHSPTTTPATPEATSPSYSTAPDLQIRTRRLKTSTRAGSITRNHGTLAPVGARLKEGLTNGEIPRRSPRRFRLNLRDEQGP